MGGAHYCNAIVMVDRQQAPFLASRTALAFERHARATPTQMALCADGKRMGICARRKSPSTSWPACCIAIAMKLGKMGKPEKRSDIGFLVDHDHP